MVIAEKYWSCTKLLGKKRGGGPEIVFMTDPNELINKANLRNYSKCARTALHTAHLSIKDIKQ